MPEPTPQDPAPQDDQQSNETFESWLAEQPDNVKTLYTTHTSGLKSALDSERKARSDAEKALRDMAKKAEKGSEYEKSLTEQADKLASLQQQSSFYDKAHLAGVRNLKLAYMAAKQESLVSDSGDCDFGKLKSAYPELFLTAPRANAGDGTGGSDKPFSMNDAIRRAAGRQ